MLVILLPMSDLFTWLGQSSYGTIKGIITYLTSSSTTSSAPAAPRATPRPAPPAFTAEDASDETQEENADISENEAAPSEENLKEAMVLPRIVVIGEEASGKSTLLQHITNKQIFPEGKSQTTRFPIRLVLQQGPNADLIVTWQGETHVFPDDSEVQNSISNFVCDAIKDQAENNAMTKDEMVITITAPNLPDIELIDLPGMCFGTCSCESL